MVQIPEFKAKTGLTSQTGTRARPVPDITAAAQAPFTAAAELAGDVQKISTRFYEAQKSLQRKTEASKLVDLYLKGDENTSGLNQLSFDAQNNPNTNSALQDFQKGHDNLVANLSNGIKDPVVKQIFTSKTNEIYNNEYLGVQSAVWKNIREDALKTLERNIGFETNKIFNAGGNKAQEFASRINIEKLIEDANRDGLGLPEDYFENTLRTIDLRKAYDLTNNNPNLFLQKKDNGDYNETIDPENLLKLTERAESNQKSIIKTQIAEVKATRQTTISSMDDMIEYMENGADVTFAEYQEMITTAMGVESVLSNFDDVESISLDIKKLKYAWDNQGVLKEALTDNTFELANRISDLENQKEKTKDKDLQVSQQSLIDSLYKIQTKRQTEVKDNMLGYWESITPGVSLPDIDITNANFEEIQDQLRDRYQFAHFAREQIDPTAPVQYFTKVEKANLKERLTDPNISILDMNAILMNIGYTAREDTPEVIDRIFGSDNPEISHLALLLQGGLTDGTMQLARAIKYSKDPANNDLFKKFKTREFTEESLLAVKNTILTPDFKKENPDTSYRISEAADLIFMSYIIENKDGLYTEGEAGDFTSDTAKRLYAQAISVAAGFEMKEGKAYGGFQEYQDGNFILLPRNMSNGSFDGSASLKEIMDNKLDVDLLSKGIQQEIYEPDGNKVSLDALLNEDGYGFKDRIFLQTIGLGQYYVTFDNPKDLDVAYYKDKFGSPIIFDLEIISEDLLSNIRKYKYRPMVEEQSLDITAP